MSKKQNDRRDGYYEQREAMRALGMMQLLHSIMDGDESEDGGRARYEAPAVMDLPRRASMRMSLGRVSVR